MFWWRVSTVRRTLPWYLVTLLMSRPLHFGDYGGASMQLVWALFDVATMIVLGSGLYLWAMPVPLALAALAAPVAVGGWYALRPVSGTKD